MLRTWALPAGPAVLAHDSAAAFGPAAEGAGDRGCMFVSELSEDAVKRLLSSARPEAPAGPTSAENRVVHEVRLRVTLRSGHVALCRIKRFHAAAAWPLPPSKVIRLS